MRKILLICVLALSATLSTAQSLVILHTNDTHSHLDPTREGRGGIIERAAYIDQVRKSMGKKKVLLLHAGDFNQGTSYFTKLNGDLEISLINALGYDCITLGNHEFDNGIEDLTRRLSSINCPVVCANYDFSSFELGKYVKPYTIIRKAGLKIGIIGVLCDLTSVVSRSVADRLPALDPVEVVNKWAEYLRNQEECDLVIALTHIGFDGGEMSDVKLASLSKNLDLIVGGHSHTNLEDIVWVDDADGKKVGVVTDGEWGKNIGRLEIYN